MDTVTEVEQSYVSKPILVDTIITPPEPPRVARMSFDSNVEYLYPDNIGDCVTWVKKQKGISEHTAIGNGARLAINQSEPQVGAIGAEKSIVHAFLVAEVKDSTIVIDESNYRDGWITRREIPKSDVIGYIY